MEIKIKEYKISRSGLRGLHITLPKVWVKDNKLEVGDYLEIYRDEKDRLIIVAKKGE